MRERFVALEADSCVPQPFAPRIICAAVNPQLRVEHPRSDQGGTGGLTTNWANNVQSGDWVNTRPSPSVWSDGKFLTPCSSSPGLPSPQSMGNYNFPWYQQRSLSCIGISEFISTACLGYTIALALALAPIDFTVPIAVAGAIGCISNITGDWSGTHMNPCVTLAVFLTEKKFTLTRTCTYIVAELIGAVMGIHIAYWNAAHFKNPFNYATHHSDDFSFWQIVVCEMVFTFLLIATILKAAFLRVEPNPFALFWIIAAVIAASFAGGPISGACLNPALVVGFVTAGGDLFDVVPYIIGPTIGTLLAVGVIMFFEPEIYAARTGLNVADWKERGTTGDRISMLERMHSEERENTAGRSRSLVRAGSSGGVKRYEVSHLAI
eukprot:Blabericola_migrator_1__8818@NODE_465_length_8250_cov_107_590737_g363_i0_p3_GENE_NODE_465_length_8250_cov_107_590737_g363_i0NODE_465_length_8250_cov_107_590737_g363_i0_p3_ORF_typecomplete_len379_score21_16MIP/PF00230_20/1_8e28Wzz/PF02706_15/1_3e04Wzz/PF02706_15/4_7e03Wzz/PF02706_15/0_85_NODE_465_length_8250_cov_107_590737_g363_i010922228